MLCNFFFFLCNKRKAKKRIEWSKQAKKRQKLDDDFRKINTKFYAKWMALLCQWNIIWLNHFLVKYCFIIGRRRFFAALFGSCVSFIIKIVAGGIYRYLLIQKKNRSVCISIIELEKFKLNGWLIENCLLWQKIVCG